MCGCRRHIERVGCCCKNWKWLLLLLMLMMCYLDCILHTDPHARVVWSCVKMLCFSLLLSIHTEPAARNEWQRLFLIIEKGRVMTSDKYTFCMCQWARVWLILSSVNIGTQYSLGINPCFTLGLSKDGDKPFFSSVSSWAGPEVGDNPISLKKRPASTFLAQKDEDKPYHSFPRRESSERGGGARAAST